MSEKNGSLNMRAGAPTLTFPGPGGFDVKWSPGARHVHLISAPSGHLILPCDHFDKVQEKGGLQKPATVFHSIDGNEAQSSGASSSQVAVAVEPVASLSRSDAGSPLEVSAVAVPAGAEEASVPPPSSP